MDQITESGGTPGTMKSCPSCGGPISVVASTCPRCGHPLGGGSRGAKTNGLAIASLILGITWLFWLGSLAAIIMGAVALGQIKRADGAESGRGMAIAGVVLGSIGVVGFLALVALTGAVLFGGEVTSSTFECTATSIGGAVQSTC